MARIERRAPAKINLTLHVTGRRDDGYHLLDSLVAFSTVGDRVEVADAPGLSFAVRGAFADSVPSGGDNLVLRAADLMAARAPTAGAAITLTKDLPPASGIGGGSSDAAATLSALSALWSVPLPGPDEILTLGADVPACLEARALRMRGIGEEIETLPPLPEVHAVLVNPGCAVSTPEVFGALENRDNAAMDALPAWTSAAELADWLSDGRNDLEAPALSLAPEIREVLAALTVRPGCLLARMSGSGATCFGLFAGQEDADAAATSLGAAHPEWWCRAGRLS
ncbi:4-(cytidine 5'-diphospho)-2-C-methyl-D-erythritol kinase [Tropicimonas sp. IMCC34011]|uniref:4-(cytidine 5'-diphospho)-2-C-methyl-D-erythritol kinase n=1 Tax=Tropicimonas sp. IMCC34011 TaxID=2248759 RepID=UPI000E24AF6B|nr:4-(cytidine 5'-diphospho)-2-C-methyl-D-erythritol kinase [Tropicimonas sp. IMCC34011]